MSPSKDQAGAKRRAVRSPGEARAPAAVAICLAIALYALLPEGLVAGPRLVIPGLEVLLLVATVALNPRRFTRETNVTRMLSLVLVLLIATTNLYALGRLVDQLVQSSVHHGKDLLLSALQVWLTNIIAFGLAYWELDRGGPVSRSLLPRTELPPADFRFSQDENAGAIDEVAATSSGKTDWRPSLVDYLYVSLTNSSAFSPTDTMPLSHRVKLLMSVQATSALVVSLLVIARGVSIIS